MNVAGRLVLYAVYIPIFGLAAWTKFSGGMPDWFVTQFHDTLLALLPGGLVVSFYFIAFLEATTTLVFVTSLARREFLQDRSPKFLSLALIAAMATFAVLGFGLRLSHDFNGAFQLFGYFALTFLIAKKDGR